MDDNEFLKSYRKKLDDKPEPAAENQPPVNLPPDDGVSEPQTDSGPEPEGETEPTSLLYEEKPTFRPPRQVRGAGGHAGRGGTRLLPIIIVCVFVLGLTGFLIWYLNRGTAAIDLVGMSLSDAQLWANENNVKLQITEEYNDEFEADQIVVQEPVAGAMLDKGGFLKITVSLGHDLTVTLPLPDLLKMTMKEVEDWAAANFMTKVRITAEYSATVASGRVIRFEINDNTVVDKVKRSTPIYVIVSKGLKPAEVVQVTLPDFKTMSVAASQQFAQENGLTLVIAEEYNDYVASGTIMAQSIAATTKVDPGTTITLNVSLGKKILVPDFSSYSREKAAAVAASLGITVTASDKYSSQALGKFVSQSVSAGTIYKTGDVVELFYSLGNKVVLSSFVGQPRSAIEAWAKDLNDKGASIRISVTQTQNNAARDTIIYQDKANISVGISTTIQITVSLGKKVFVPDVVAAAGVGYDQAFLRADAEAALEAVGLVAVFVEEASAGRLPGEVWYQSEPAGTEVYEGTIITLKYAPANVTYDIPSFAGMSRQAILDAGWLKKLKITFVDAEEHVAGYDNTVSAQSLPVGQTVPAGTSITLTISPLAPVETTPAATTTEAP